MGLLGWLAATFGGAAIGAFIGAITLHRSRWIEMQTICRALSREVLLLTRRLNECNKSLGREPLRIDSEDMAVFRGNVSKLGLLEPWAVLRIMKFYSFVRDAIRVSQTTDSALDRLGANEAREGAIAKRLRACEEAWYYGVFGISGFDQSKGLARIMNGFSQTGWLRALVYRARENLAERIRPNDE